MKKISFKKFGWISSSRRLRSPTTEAQPCENVPFVDKEGTNRSTHTRLTNRSTSSHDTCVTNNNVLVPKKEKMMATTEVRDEFSVDIGQQTLKLPDLTAKAKQFIDILNNGKSNTLCTVASPKCIFVFHDAEALVYSFMEDGDRLGSSFPDFHLTYERIEILSPTQVKIVNLQASGTHTGSPYGFGPYPKISATNKRCVNDYEDATITIDNKTGLIRSVKFVAKGPSTGPPGFYKQIGGTI